MALTTNEKNYIWGVKADAKAQGKTLSLPELRVEVSNYRKQQQYFDEVKAKKEEIKQSSGFLGRGVSAAKGAITPAIFGVKKIGKGLGDVWGSITSNKQFNYGEGEDIEGRGFMDRVEQGLYGVGEGAVGALGVASNFIPVVPVAGAVMGGLDPELKYLVEQGMDTETARFVSENYKKIPAVGRKPIELVAEGYLLGGKNPLKWAKGQFGGAIGSAKQITKKLESTGMAIKEEGGTLKEQFKALANKESRDRILENIKSNPYESFKLKEDIISKYRKALAPKKGKTNFAEIANKNENIVLGAKTVVKETGIIPKTMNEAAEAISNARKTVLNKFKGIGRDIPISLKGVVDFLENADSFSARFLGSNFTKIKNDLLNSIKKTSPEGITTLDQAEDILQRLNTDVNKATSSSFFSGVNNSDEIFLKNEIAKTLREDMYSALDGLGDEYSTLRREFGSLKEMEKDLAGKIVQQANKNGAGIGDTIDTFTIMEALSAIALQNPVAFAKSAGIFGTRSVLKYMNDPNNLMSKVFQYADDLNKFQTMKALSPSAQKSLQNMKEYLKQSAPEKEQSTIFKKASEKAAKKMEVGKEKLATAEKGTRGVFPIKLSVPKATPETINLPKITDSTKKEILTKLSGGKGVKITPKEFAEGARAKGFTEKTVSIDKIKASRTKPREDVILKNIEKLKKGEELEPIVISKDGNVVDGNHRLEAYRRMGIKKIPVLVGK